MLHPHCTLLRFVDFSINNDDDDDDGGGGGESKMTAGGLQLI